MGVEMGVAEKLAIKALARASGESESVIQAELQKSGDIGETSQKLLAKRKQSTFFTKHSPSSGSTRRLTKWQKPQAAAP